MQAKDIMSDGVLSVSADASVFEAVRLLVNWSISAMPVVNEAGTMTGIVSEADLIIDAEDYATAGEEGSLRKVVDVMTKDVITASEDTPIAELARQMKERDIKRIPILTKGAVVGIVSRVDILRGLMSLSQDGGKDQPGLPRDSELRRQVRAACQGRTWSLAKQVDVAVNRGIAHLWGVAPTDLVRQAYRAAAENVPGINTVQVHMRVVPPAATRVGLS